jgi:hypothetical protein
MIRTPELVQVKITGLSRHARRIMIGDRLHREQRCQSGCDPQHDEISGLLTKSMREDQLSIAEVCYQEVQDLITSLRVLGLIL